MFGVIVFALAAALAFSQPDGGGATRQAAGGNDAPATADRDTTQPSTGPSTAPTSAPASSPSPSADEVLGRMLKPRRVGQQQELIVNEAPAADRTSGEGAVKPNAPVLTVMREGTPIVNRVGRLTLPGAAGNNAAQAEFTFEADGAALRDPPLIVLPNLKLMAMEEAVRGQARDLRFRVSGIVTEYRGRNYVLLEKVTVVQDITQQFLR